MQGRLRPPLQRGSHRRRGREASLDTVCSLLTPEIPTMGGGVFVVVRCANAHSREILITKGLVPNRAGTVAMIYRPYYLCGVEAPISIITAARLGLPTGARDARPRWEGRSKARLEGWDGD